jgi:hypothetical protein
MNHTLALRYPRSFTTLAIAFGFAMYSNAVSAQCSKDTDCKGDRLCVKGVCVDAPGRTTGTGSAIPEKPTPVNGGNTPSTDRAPAPAPARTPYSNRETANPGSLEQLSASLEKGEKVVFAVRTGVNEVHGREIGSHEVVVSKTAVEFRAKGGQDIFVVSPEKILALDREPQSWRLRMKVAVSQTSGTKEKKEKIELFHPGVWKMGGVYCTGCDTSMDVLYALLQTVRGQDFETSLAKSQAAARNAELAKQLERERYEAEAARLAAECPGIELMGLYKNEIFDKAMGGGVVEWLAKVRNNSGITKIVVIGWRDSEGQQRRTQIQIRGGEIASPRVDMSQARPIPPVADLRLLSCQ